MLDHRDSWISTTKHPNCNSCREALVLAQDAAERQGKSWLRFHIEPGEGPKHWGQVELVPETPTEDMEHGFLKGRTVYVVTTEGRYPGNASAPVVFADEEEAETYKEETEAVRIGKPLHQVNWCEIEPMIIR